MKAFLLTKHRWKCFLCFFFALSLVIATAVFITQNTAVSSPSLQKRLPIYSVSVTEKQIALTFDNAWENSDISTLLEILAQNEVKATFFTTGDWCERYPEDTVRLAEAGHDVQNHSYSHPHVASISREELMEDTQKCDDIIESLTGQRPTLYRAPYGEYDDEMLALLEDELQHKVIQWDVDSRDWKKREAADMVQDVQKSVSPGSILLFHTDTPNTPAALRQLLPLLKGEEYEFVLVKDLICTGPYTLDHTGRQIPSSSETAALE